MSDLMKDESLKVRLFDLFYHFPLSSFLRSVRALFAAIIRMHDYACNNNYTCTCAWTCVEIDRPWEDDVIYENTMDFDGHDNEGIFIDAGPQL